MSLESWPMTPDAWLLDWLVWRFKNKSYARPAAAPQMIPPYAWEVAQWCEWRRKGGLPPRPDVTKAIPAWGWTTLKALNQALQPPPPAPVNLGVFANPGAYVSNPASGYEAEKPAELAAHGFGWLGLEASRTGWDDWRMIAASHQLPVIPWQQCLGPEDVQAVVNVAHAWGAPALTVNVEAESMTTLPPAAVAKVLDLEWGGPACILGSPWFENGAGWQSLAHYVGSPEAYLNADARWKPDVVVAHAYDEGFRAVFPTFGVGKWADAQRDVTPDDYFLDWPKGPYALWMIDQLQPEEIRNWARA